MELPPEAHRQAGRFSYAQARASGISRRALARAVTAGVVVEISHGVYAAASAARPADPVLKHRAMVIDEQLARGRGWAAARRSAAALMGLPLIGAIPATPQLARDAAGTLSHGTRHARVTTLPPLHRVRYDSVLMSSPARTVVDIARDEALRNAVVTADAALRRGVERADLEQVLGYMTRWPGVGRARAVVALADGRAESPGESLARLGLHVARLPPAEPQVEVWRDGAFVARLDLLVREHLLAVEFNGALKFTDAGVLPALLSRQENVRACGIDVLNTDWDEVFGRTNAFTDRVRERVADRGWPQLPPGVELRSTAVRPQAPSLGLPSGAQARAA